MQHLLTALFTPADPKQCTEVFNSYVVWVWMSAVECSKQDASITSLCTATARHWKSNTKRAKTQIFHHLILSYVMFLSYFPDVLKPSSSLVWSYLRIRCHPCPHCLRLTGQTSADQGLHCAQTVSKTHNTSLQITHGRQNEKKNTLYDLFLLSLFSTDE